MEKNFKIKSLVVSSFILSVLVLFGCSSSGGDGGSNTPNGIYSGSVTGGDPLLNGLEEKAIIYDGRLMVLSNNVDGVSQFFDVNLAEPSRSLTGTGVRFHGSGSKLNDVAFSGAYVVDQSATVEFTQTGSAIFTLPTGTINLTDEAAIYIKGADISKLSGTTWTGIHDKDFNVSMSLMIDASGNISAGSGDLGGVFDCGFTGSFSVINPAINVYSLNLISDGGSNTCFMPAGAYTGLSWLEGDEDGVLVMMASNGNSSRAVVLTRN
ncbi:MAG: hypothetical protein QM500_16005 [Methylococcales bacterium]